MNTSNISKLAYYRDQWESRQRLQTRIFRATVAVGVLDAVWVVFVNLLLICVLLSSRRLRGVFRNQLIVNIAVSDLMIGVICIPLKVDFALNRKRNYGCTMHVAYQIIEIYLQIFVASWCIVMVNFDFILERLQIARPRLSRSCRTLLSVQLLALPWAIACIVIMPIIFVSLHPIWSVSSWSERYCPILLVKWATVTLSVLCFFLPGIIILFQVGAILAIFYKKRPAGVASLGLLTYSDSARDTAVITSASLVTVLMLCGEEIWFVMADYMGSSWTYHTMVLSGFIFGVCADIKSAVLPIVWMALPEIWETIKSNLRWRPWRQYVQHHDVEVTYYRNYGDDLSP
ncbi:histamine H3 receptor-like [Haliotis rufescens]|uniref:histamine H3 receptor-like n=1 Tax=Haliotis rufescens TaxID=6454 RepID=UPI001EAFF4E5|nr:histamine H3 receptor-like [Haliotis rufescens]XP_046350531.1 histamine H3 receptor-like [Haliotis rufescens]